MTDQQCFELMHVVSEIKNDLHEIKTDLKEIKQDLHEIKVICSRPQQAHAV